MDLVKKYWIYAGLILLAVWIYTLETKIQKMQISTEQWSQHMAHKMAEVENKANLKYEADLETLELMFDMIYKLKQMEADDNAD